MKNKHFPKKLTYSLWYQSTITKTWHRANANDYLYCKKSKYTCGFSHKNEGNSYIRQIDVLVYLRRFKSSKRLLYNLHISRQHDRRAEEKKKENSKEIVSRVVGISLVKGSEEFWPVERKRKLIYTAMRVNRASSTQGNLITIQKSEPEVRQPLSEFTNNTSFLFMHLRAHLRPVDIELETVRFGAWRCERQRIKKVYWCVRCGSVCGNVIYTRMGRIR